MAKRKRRPARQPAVRGQGGNGTGQPAKFQHAEAFNLMKYRCEKCGHVETIWNSRDGVTPFTVTCVSCRAGSMVHFDWRGDVRAPEYVPQPGQYIWVDMPESLKAPLARWRIALAEGTPAEVPPERRAEIIKAILEGFHEGEPWIIQWPA